MKISEVINTQQTIDTTLDDFLNTSEGETVLEAIQEEDWWLFFNLLRDGKDQSTKVEKQLVARIFNFKDRLSISLGKHMGKIQGDYFEGCTWLKTISIPQGITSIGFMAFGGCRCLTTVEIPDSVTYIGDQAFGNCNSLTSINIPSSITFISNWMFRGCDKLKSIVIPPSITYIGTCAFEYCHSLESVTIPSSVKKIKGWAFVECYPLTKLIFNGTEAQWESIDKELDYLTRAPVEEIVCIDGVIKLKN